MSNIVSIIIPIYNMEKLMRKCLDSILAQTFTDYECLLIDDGSTDGSPAICDEYAAKDTRFKAFHKPNGGLSDARNYGLAHAQGEYTIFFDPDDWVDEDCLKDMYAKAQETNADMVMCDLYYNDPYRQRYCKQEPTALNSSALLKDLIVGRIEGFTVNKLIRRKLYDKYDLRYPIDIYGCEDQYLMCKLFKSDVKVVYFSRAYYHYMHYGLKTLSRRYDEMTYHNNVLIRERFNDLLKDTPFCEYMYRKKSAYIVSHAFAYGYQFYTSKLFKEIFGKYQDAIMEVTDSKLMKIIYYISLHGGYRPVRLFFEMLFICKQKMKKVRFIIIKKMQ